MNATKIIAAAVLTLGGLAGAGYVYMQSQAIDNSRLDRAIALVQTLQGLDGRWSVELLKVNANPEAHFDGLAAISPEVMRHSKELKKIARTEPAVPPELKASLMGYLSRLDSKGERVERFKSAYAIVRNSQRYLPLAVQMVSVRTGEFQQASLDRSVQTYLADVNGYAQTPSDAEKGRILANLSKLRAGRDQYPPTLRSALGNFIAHALVLVAQTGPLNELLASATDLEAASVATVLIEDITALTTMRTAERVGLERMAFGIAVATLIVLVMFVAFARRPASAGPQLAGAVTANGTLIQASPDAPTALGYQAHDPDATVAAPAGRGAPAPVAPVAPPPAATRTVDMREQIQTEFLAQLVRATARRLGSHIGLMKEVYGEVSKGVAESQANLVVGDNRTANSAIIETKATLGELGDLLDLNSVPKLVEATTRTIEEVDRASTGFHASIQSRIETERAPFDVAECVEMALKLSGIDDGQVTVRKNLVKVGEANGSIDEMAAAFRCILDNAREELTGSENPGAVTVQTTEELGAITVTISDNGGGIDPETRQTCTQAFVSTKDEHEGLGLSVAEYIIRKHGGRLSLNSVLGKGTVVRVVLPADGDELPPE